MKTQMRFQKILVIITIVIGALGVFFALAYCSGAYNQLCRMGDSAVDGLGEFVEAVQSANDTLLTMGIILILGSILPVIFACGKRRNYYMDNYVAIGITLVIQLVYIIVLIITVTSVMSVYSGVDFEGAQSIYDSLMIGDDFGAFTTKPWTPFFGFAVVGLVVLNMVALVLNMLWKIKLMKGEKKLLENVGEAGEVKEVA